MNLVVCAIGMNVNSYLGNDVWLDILLDNFFVFDETFSVVQRKTEVDADNYDFQRKSIFVSYDQVSSGLKLELLTKWKDFVVI